MANENDCYNHLQSIAIGCCRRQFETTFADYAHTAERGGGVLLFSVDTKGGLFQRS